MKLVIFDCDGTLIDSQHTIVAAIGDAFLGQGLAVPSRDDVMAVIGLSLPEAFGVLAPEQDKDAQFELARLYRSAFTTRRKAETDQEPLYHGIGDVVATLASQPEVVLAIATGKARPGVDRLLKREGWSDVFASIQTADTHPSKPHPSMILQALKDSGLAADRAVMIGDTTFDVEMARAAETCALGVAWGYHPVSDLHRAGAHHVSQSPQALVQDINHVLEDQGHTVG